MKFTNLPKLKIEPNTSGLKKNSVNSTGWRLVSYFGDNILHRKRLGNFKTNPLKRF